MVCLQPVWSSQFFLARCSIEVLFPDFNHYFGEFVFITGWKNWQNYKKMNELFFMAAATILLMYSYMTAHTDLLLNVLILTRIQNELINTDT